MRGPSLYFPVPLSGTVCGLPTALSFTVIDPVLAPFTLGLNTTEIVQLAPAPSVPPQSSVLEKSPLALMLSAVRGTFCLLVNVSAFAALDVPTTWPAKVNIFGASVTGTVPFPDRLTDWGLLAALSLIEREPVCALITVGEKTTAIVHFPPAAICVPQSLVWLKSPVTPPLMAA